MHFYYLKKRNPKDAKKFVRDQELLVNFLNSMAKFELLNTLDLKKSEIAKMTKIIEHYAKMKIEREKKAKKLTKTEVIKIEDYCLRKMFIGKLVKIRNVDKEKIKDFSFKLIKMEFPKAVILTEDKIKKLIKLFNLKGTPTDYLVFDPSKMKIIAVEIEPI